MVEAEITKLAAQEIKRTTARQVKDKANAEAWNVNVTIFS